MTAVPLVSPRSIAVTGASGLVGRALIAALTGRGHRVVALTRQAAGDGRREGGATWASYDPTNPASLAAALSGCGAVVHLAGENLFGARWSAAVMERIRASRAEGTRALVEALRAMGAARPGVLVSTSAVGYYGPLEPEASADESAPAGTDFLAGVCREWEAEARRAEALGVRVAIARVGVVLSREGGALRKMRLPFKLGLGGPIGRGRQVLSWIHADDLVAMYVAMVEDGRWSGPFNATAPGAVTSREFARALGRAMGRPAFLPTPAFALRLALGRVASILTTGQRVLPRAAEALGFAWRHPDIDGALAALVG